MGRAGTSTLADSGETPRTAVWRFLLRPYERAAASEADQLLFRRMTIVVLIAVSAAITNATIDVLRSAIVIQSYWVLSASLLCPWVVCWRWPRLLRFCVQVGFAGALSALVFGVHGAALIGSPSILGMAYASTIPIVAAFAVSARNALVWMWLSLGATLVAAAGTVAVLPDAASTTGNHANTTLTVVLLIAITSAFAIAGRRQNDRQHARMAEMNATLESTVAQRTAELADALDAAQAASRAKGAFVANMSHELRTPLNGVLGVAELLGDTSLDAEQGALLENLQTSGRALQDTLGSILDFATMESGGIELTDHPFDPAEVVHRAVSDFAPAVHAKGVDLSVACAPDLPETVTGDALQFGRAIERLVSNAVKFTELGCIGVFCWFEHAATPGSIVDGTLCVQVQDTGPGIDAARLDRLWEAFAPGDDSSQKAYAGIGLGLTLVREYARLSGGTVEVDSILGTGTTFTLRLPTTGTLAEPRVLPVTPGRIGVVAGPLSRWSLAYILATARAEAEPVTNDADLVCFDAVVVDRSSPEGKAFRVPPGMRCVELGVAQGLASPVRPEALLFALASALPLTAAIESSESKPALAPDEPDAVPAETQTAPKAVLIVEDNPVNRKVLTKMVATLGYETLMAENGQEGADTYMAQPETIAAVLMDCQMPVLDGFGSTRVIRTFESGRRRCPIIAVTANALEGDRDKCLACGMDDFLAKPVDRARLAAVLREWAPVDAPVTA